LLKDSAVSSVHPPIGGSTEPSNNAIVLTNVQVGINRWSGTSPLLPDIIGQGNDVALNYTIAADASRIMSLKKDTVSQTLQAIPATVHVGGSAMLTWRSKGANSCSAGGAWTGTLATEGSQTVTLTVAGNHDFTLNCQKGSDFWVTKLRVIVEP
jgi:hypothetical protein